MADLYSLRDHLRRFVQNRMAADPAHDLAHLDRVWANAQLIARDEGDVDLRILLAATYLHDLINLPKDSSNRAQASTLSAEAAVPVLRDLGFSAVEIAAAGHAIASHSYSAGLTPESVEAKILRDADRLDALGAIGIARTFLVSGAMARALYDPTDPFAANRPLDDHVWAIDHWKAKLLQLPCDMLTRRGRAIADDRARLMLDYLAQLSLEIAAPIPEHWNEPIS